MESLSVPAFSPEPAATAASRWGGWLKRFDNFVAAQAITADARKRALLLHFGGEEVFEVSETVETGSTYDELKTALTNHFAPQKNVEYEIFMFRQATQQPGETLDKFYVRLKLLSKNCDFGNVDREIKSQIIQKCSMVKVRHKGLSEPAVELKDLLTYGRTLEATSVHAEAMCANSSEPATGVHKVNSDVDSRSNPVSVRKRQYSTRSGQDRYRCGGCGRVHSDDREKVCRAWGKQCFKCSKPNHFASCCRGSRTSTRPVSSARFIDLEHSSDEDPGALSHGVGRRSPVDDYSGEDVLPLHTVNSGKTVAPYLCTLQLNGVKTQMEIDTGAASTILNTQVFRKIKQHTGKILLRKDDLPVLRTYSGELIQPLGRAMLDVVYGEQHLKLSALVVPSTGPCLLGRDWLQHIKINWVGMQYLQTKDYVHLFPELFKPGLGTLRNYEAKLWIDPEVQPRFSSLALFHTL